MKIICILLFTVFSSKVMAHGGEVHSSAPASSSLMKSSFSSNNESPFSVGFKLRSGYEYGVYVGAFDLT